MSGPSRKPTDPKLLEQCLLGIAKGNREDFETLYRLTDTGVYAFALSVVKNPQDAQDVMHDAYLKIYSAATFYRPNGTPMAWILTVVKNLCLSKLRERSKTADLPPEEWDLHLPAEEDGDRETKLALTEELKALTEEERQIVVLHAVSDVKHRDIAKLLNLPLPTVLSKYRRALKKLEKAL